MENVILFIISIIYLALINLPEKKTAKGNEIEILQNYEYKTGFSLIPFVKSGI